VTGHDLAMLQDRWQQIGMEADGIVDPADNRDRSYAVTTVSAETQRA
jgi:hypothetical protein